MSLYFVYRIVDPSREYSRKELHGKCIRVTLKSDATIENLKQRVAGKLGTPVSRHRYYGVSRRTHNTYRFATEEILRGDDGRRAFATLTDLTTRGIIGYSRYVIAVVLLPAEGDGVRVIRRVTASDAIARRIEVGRANAVEIDDDSGEHDGQPQPKRQRRAKSKARDEEREGGTEQSSASSTGAATESSSSSQSSASRQGVEGSGESTEPAGDRSNDNSPGECIRAASAAAGYPGPRVSGDGTDSVSEDKEGAGMPQGGEEGEDERASKERNSGQSEAGTVSETAENENEEETVDGTDPAAAIADGAGEAVAPVAAAGQPEPANEDATEVGTTGAIGPAAAGAVEHAGDAPQSLRQWLQGLEVDGTPAGRFERYTAAFEREFGSLKDLAIVADSPRHGLESILQVCGVQSLGDKGRIEWAIAKLPRPE